MYTVFYQSDTRNFLKKAIASDRWKKNAVSTQGTEKSDRIACNLLDITASMQMRVCMNDTAEKKLLLEFTQV